MWEFSTVALQKSLHNSASAIAITWQLMEELPLKTCAFNENISWLLFFFIQLNFPERSWQLFTRAFSLGHAHSSLYQMILWL